jgi:hypothetical protein
MPASVAGRLQAYPLLQNGSTLEDFNTQKAYDIKILETIVIRVCDYKQYPKITNQRAPINIH